MSDITTLADLDAASRLLRTEFTIEKPRSIISLHDMERAILPLKHFNSGSSGSEEDFI